MFVHQSDNSQGKYMYNSHIFHRVHWPAHFHRSLEFVYLFQGSFTAVIDGQVTILEPGDFLLCLSNQVHDYTAAPGSRFWIGVFSGDYVPEFEAAIKGKVGKTCRFRCDDTILAFLEKHILLDFQSPIPPFHRLSAALNLLCGEYLQSVELVERDNSEYSLMNDICDYILSNFRNKLTLKDVAIALGYDYYYFSRLFRQTFGICFVDYLNACRCNAASNALRDTDKTITAIALDSGFQSVRTFNDVFLKSMGTSPAQFRKMLRQKTQSV